MDLKTVIVSLILINFFLGIFTYLIKKSQANFKNLESWILANFIIATGYLLIVLRTKIPDFLSIVIANSFFLISGIVRIYGFKKLFKIAIKRIELYLAAGGLAIFFCLLIYFTHIQNNIFIRSIITMLVVSSISTYIGILVLKHKSPKNKAIYHITAIAFFSFSSVFVIRIAAWLISPVFREVFYNSLFNYLPAASSMLIDITWTVMFLYISNQKATEKQLESDARFKNMFANHNSIMLLIDPQTGAIIDANIAASKYYGYSNAALCQMHLSDISSLTIEEINIELKNATFHENHVQVFSNKLASGEDRIVEIHSSTIFYGEKKYLFSIVNDITERKQSEIKLQIYANELQKLNIDKDFFMQILAHDLRGSFSSLSGYSDLLIENMHEYNLETIAHQLQIINKTTHQTYNLLEQILMWAKSQSGKLNIEPTQFSFFEIVNDLIIGLSYLSEAKFIKIKCSGNERIRIVADLNMFKTVMRNLISNAIKFTNPHGNIEIYAQKENSNISISVSDTGVGIAEEIIPKLWEFKSQYITTGTNDEKGTGFGLVLCKELVEKLGGKIWVESKPGLGSVFKFSIPAGNSQTFNLAEIKEEPVKKKDLNKKEIQKAFEYSTEFLQNILPLKKSLSAFNYYETSEILKLIQSFGLVTDEYLKWKNEIESSVLNSNKNKYLELIKY